MSDRTRTDPHARADQRSPGLREHYKRKDAEPSELFKQIAEEELRIEKRGAARTFVCVICGERGNLDSLAFAAAIVFSRQLRERGEEPIKPSECGFTCSGPCIAAKAKQEQAERNRSTVTYEDRQRMAAGDSDDAL